MLLRLGYLAVSNVFAVLRLPPMGDQDKDVEILVLRHQIAVLERQLGQQWLRFTAADRVICRMARTSFRQSTPSTPTR